MIFQDRGLAINSSLITEENDDKPYIYFIYIIIYIYLYIANFYFGIL